MDPSCYASNFMTTQSTPKSQVLDKPDVDVKSWIFPGKHRSQNICNHILQVKPDTNVKYMLGSFENQKKVMIGL